MKSPKNPKSLFKNHLKFAIKKEEKNIKYFFLYLFFILIKLNTYYKYIQEELDF
jgi:hypothetical protein